MGMFERFVTLNGLVEKSMWLLLVIFYSVMYALHLLGVDPFLGGPFVIILFLFLADRFVCWILVSFRFVTAHLNETWSQKIVGKILWNDWLVSGAQREIYLERCPA